MANIHKITFTKEPDCIIKTYKVQEKLSKIGPVPGFPKKKMMTKTVMGKSNNKPIWHTLGYGNYLEYAFATPSSTLGFF